MESEEEFLSLEVDSALSLDDIASGLNTHLPEGLKVTGCRRRTKGGHAPDKISHYTIALPEGSISSDEIDAFINLRSFTVEDTGKKGRVRVTDLRKAVEKISWIDEHTFHMTISRTDTRTIRPALVLSSYFKLDEDAVRSARIRKIKQGQFSC